MSLSQDLLITLPSNVKSDDIFEHNTISNYKTKLSRRLTFPKNEDWRVGLAEIQFTATWYNIRQSQRVLFYDLHGKILNMGLSEMVVKSVSGLGDTDRDSDPCRGVCIKPGFYESIDVLINAINNALLKLKPYCTLIPVLKYDKINHRVTVIGGTQKEDPHPMFFPDFGPEVESILGLLDKDNQSMRSITLKNSLLAGKNKTYAKPAFEMFSAGRYDGHRAAELNADSRSLFVYCDITEPSFVGNSFTQLLRVVDVPYGVKFNQQITRTYNEPHFMPLITNVFDTIQIDIKDDTGRQMPFEHGRVIVIQEI